MHHPTLCTLAVGLLSALPGAQAGIYTKKSPVLQVDAKNYDKLIANCNQTSARVAVSVLHTMCNVTWPTD